MKQAVVLVVGLLASAMSLAAECAFEVIAHRGASGERPEHTMAAYELAIEQGADYIEPDLVATQDGVLVARHEAALAAVDGDGAPVLATTNVAELPKFASRLTTKQFYGRTVRGWFVDDFSYEEVSELRARERYANIRLDSRAHDDQLPIPRVEDIFALAARHNVGVYPELKHPDYYRAKGVDLPALLLAALAPYPDLKVVIQSFDPQALKQIAAAAPGRYPLVQLLPRTLFDEAQLAAIARYADGIGIPIPIALEAPLVANAVDAGLMVHAYTLRAEADFLPSGQSLEDVLDGLAQAGVQGVFTDHPGRVSQRLKVSCGST